MTAIFIILAAAACLVTGYMTYGRWLAAQWGIDPGRKTPAQTMEDGIDYVAAPPAVLMGHHFASIAGAGPINGPIQAAVFGWVPVFLWCIIGGIFFGGLQDFGALFASIRHDGKSVGEVIRQSMGPRAGKLFTLFGIMVLLLIVASFVNVVAGTFIQGLDPDHPHIGFTTDPISGQTTAMVSLLFIVLAIFYGFMTNRLGISVRNASFIAVLGIALITATGMACGVSLDRTGWILVIGIYITVASMLPVWVMLQPRDYLSSFLLYGMMAVAIVGVFLTGVDVGGPADFEIPAFAGMATNIGPVFPALFITVACGACSGFHSLVATGTSSKQIASEKHALPIGYGSMLVESFLAIISMIAVGMVFARFKQGEFGSPSTAFASGIALMFGAEGTDLYRVLYALLTLAVSVFALTSLDTATRLSRFMITELFLKDGEATWRDATGPRKLFAHPLFGTVMMVGAGCVIGGLSLTDIWSLFGAANQLLAGLALMAVSAWLGELGKNNKMFYFPMGFMLIATETQLVRTVILKLDRGLADWGDYFQLIFAAVLAVLALVLVAESVGTFRRIDEHRSDAAMREDDFF